MSFNIYAVKAYPFLLFFSRLEMNISLWFCYYCQDNEHFAIIPFLVIYYSSIGEST